METKELMIGDWVFSRGENTRVYDLSEEGINSEWWQDHDEYETDFHPIPLTAEILEKNGLDKVPELSMVLNRDTIPLYHSPMLHYVHELQHALRLCGLNELADNFKV